MKYCSVCKQTVVPIKNYNTGIFWFLLVAGLVVVFPIAFLFSFYDPNVCPDEKSLSQCMSEANTYVENHTPTTDESAIVTIKIIVGVFLSIIPSILYRHFSKKVCPMCNSS